MRKRWPSLLLGVVVSAVALVYLFRRDLSGVQSELRHAQYVWVVPCMALSYGGLWLRSLRWRVLLGYRIAPARSFHILNVSYFVNGVLPLRVGELVRAVLAARIDPPLPVFTSLGTIVVELRWPSSRWWGWYWRCCQSGWKSAFWVWRWASAR